MKFPCLIATCLCISATHAQEGRTGISGRIVSSEDHQPVAYASIRLVERGTGTVSNDSGAFFLWVPSASLSDTVLVSHLGFRSRRIALSAITNEIVLEKEAVEMREVVVADPLEIIQKAVVRIPVNYLTRPYVTKGFYRATARKDSVYSFLSETLFDIYNFDYADKKQSQFHLVKHREFEDSVAMTDLNIGMKAEELIAADLVHHLDDIKVFGKGGRKKYEYALQGIVDFGDRKAYEIAFDQKDGLRESLLKGIVYIDTKSYAFLYFDYDLSPKGLPYDHFPEDAAKRTLLKMFGIWVNRKQDHYRISYRPLGKKWVLSDMTEDVHWRLQLSKKDGPADVFPAVRYVVTDVDTTVSAPFAGNQTVRGNELIENERIDGDSLFWKDYTVILPDFPEEPVIRRIKEANAANAAKAAKAAKTKR